ncbi:MAG: nucleotidyltransferase domain-containing protein [Planctomycetes bacterium]|nr:nucleotidyltransferase domain-containing protein [Planctomycetota bacterium]
MPAFLDACLHALRQGFGGRLVSVVLFGSLARGDHDEERSDVDLLVIAEGLPPDRKGRYRAFDAALSAVRSVLQDLAARGCYVSFSPVLKTPEEARYHTPLYLDMVHEGRLLHDRDGFFAGVLDGLRRRLDEVGARRVVLPGGEAYWDLKPDYRFGEVFEI